MSGRFITLEGGEGAGKSTLARALAQRLEGAGHRVAVTREPGGSPKAEAIRTAILSGRFKEQGAFAEALMFSAARIDHIDSLIRPALERGDWVSCDRFIDSTRVYQGAAGALSASTIEGLEALVVGDERPDLTIVLDVPPDVGLARVRARSAATDGFEARGLDYHERLRAGFLLLAMKAAGIPMGLIGGAIAQVYLSRASDEWRAGRLPQFTTQIIVRLTALGVGPLVAIGIVAPSVMPLVFGTEWARAGVMISWMTPWFIMQFLASPVSMSLHVTDNQPLALLNQLGGLVLRVGLTALAARYLAGHVVEVYAVSGLVFYFIYLAIVLRVSGVRLGDLGRDSRKGLLIVGAWSVVAVAATLALDLLLRAFMPTN